MIKIDFYILKSFDTFIANTMIVLFGLIPFFVPFSFQFFMPDFMLCVLYFWAIYAPEKVFLIMILVMGALQDTHLGLPLGTFSVGNLIFFISSLSYHQYLVKKPFILSWLVFGFIVIITSLFKMGFNIFVLLRPFYTEKFIYEAIMTFFTYPAIASLCFNLHQKFR